MLWLGRTPANQIWHACASEVIHDSLEKMLLKAFPFPSREGVKECFLDAENLTTKRIPGRHCDFVLSSESLDDLGDQVEWFAPKPPDVLFRNADSRDTASFIKLLVQTKSKKTVAGIMLLVDAIYTLEELRRVLEASFETNEKRPGMFLVVASPCQPMPTLRPQRPGDLVRSAIFRCDNPSCRSRGLEVLVPTRNHVQYILKPEEIAIACPNCPGSWTEHWALSFVGKPSLGSSNSSMVVESPSRRMPRRTSMHAGPMRAVMKIPEATPWVGWSSKTIPDLSHSLKQFIESKSLVDLRKAILRDPITTGGLIAGMLDAENLKVMIDSIRRMPLENKNDELAEAIALALCPRRTGNYKTEPDAYQESHFHYIAFSPVNFIQRLKVFGCFRKTGKFLDIGCGLGEKVFLAHVFGQFSRCDGLEYDAKTFAVAEFLLDRIQPRDHYPIKLIQGDALAFDDYGDYEVVYMYRPMRDHGLMRKLMRRVAAQIKPGAIMLDVLRDRCVFKKIARNEFLTVGEVPMEGEAIWDTPADFDLMFERMGIAD
jgi:SAM-dependent methyltransferase